MFYIYYFFRESSAKACHCEEFSSYSEFCRSLGRAVVAGWEVEITEQADMHTVAHCK